MKDTKKILRLAIFNALNGNITYETVNVPVFEGKVWNSVPSDLFISLGSQQEKAVERNSSAFVTESSLEFDIIQKTNNEVSKDAIDDIYEDIMEILFPTIGTIGLTVPSGFQFLEGFRESSSSSNLFISETQSVIVCTVKVTFTIIQQ